MKRANFYTRTKEIEGITYTAQFNGISAFLKMIDDCKDENGDFNPLRLGEYICDNIIVDPKISVDSFEDIETYNKVVRWAVDVAQGKFRSKNKVTAEKTGS